MIGADYDFVQVTHETFKSCRREYNNWHQAWVREILQNAIDANASIIDIHTNVNQVTVHDNGCGMTEDILRNKLFVINASGKNCEGTVGGFGKAKELLFFGQKEYQILTNNLYVHGYANRFKIIPKKYEPGTQIIVEIDDNRDPNWAGLFEHFFNSCTWPGTAIINGVTYSHRLVPGDLIHNMEFGDLRKTTYRPNYMLVRVGGIPMYETYVGNDTALLLDLKGKSYDLLTVSRDNLAEDPRNKMEQWVCEFAKNSKTALLKKTCKITLYKGQKGIIYLKKDKEDNTIYEIQPSNGPIVVRTRDNSGDTIKLEITERKEIRANIQYDCIIQNMLETDPPSLYIPNGFGVNARWLLNAWTIAIYELHLLFDLESAFYTGFLFSNDFEACFGHYNKYPMFLINPVKGLEMRYQKKRLYCCQILANAVHEFGHIDSSYHDEQFCAKLTDNMGLVMDQAPHVIKKMLEGEIYV